MKTKELTQEADACFAQLPLTELRKRWAEAWGMEPHCRISRMMLVKSLEYKIRENEGLGLTPSQQDRLDQLVKQYKRNPRSFGDVQVQIKPGTRLIRVFNGERHSVLVQEKGFEYKNKLYSSLSDIASTITGSRWNGWVFFGLKKKKANA